ncbi:MAG: O-antigen ligase family protein, partial [Clostridia bacterium]|nr:O-antigen ligase family protein [Clostridia bacterium]
FTALYTLLSAFGILGSLNFPGAYSAAEHERWLQGTVQYHNTFGILMLIGFFMACGLNTKPFKTAGFFANGIASFLFMLCLLMSYSRGAWLMVPVLFVIFLIFALPAQKVRFFATGISSLGASLAVMPHLSKLIIAQKGGTALLVLLGAMLVFAGIYVACNWIFEKWSQTKNFKKVGISILALIIVLALLVMFVPALTNLLPAQLADRLSGFSLGGETVKERFVFYGDAFELYKNHNVVTGNGGNAWAYLYGMYQSYDYATTQAHSYFMQILVEAGALGFICWLAVVGLFVWQCIRAYKNQKADKNAIAVLACIGFALILHSLIDFDLSIPAVLLLLFTVFGMLSGIAPLSFGKKEIEINKWIGVVLTAVVFLFSALGFLAVQSYDNCNAHLQTASPDDLKKAQDEAETAASLMPLNQEYASVALYVRAINGEEITPAEVDQIVEADGYNKTVLENAFYCYDKAGDYNGAYTCLESIMKLDPKNEMHYLDLINVSRVAMLQELKSENYDNAKRIAKSYLSYYNKIEKAVEHSVDKELLTIEMQQTKLYAETLIEIAPADAIDTITYMNKLIDIAENNNTDKNRLANLYGEYANLALAAMQNSVKNGDMDSAQQIAIDVKITKESSLLVAATIATQHKDSIESALIYAEPLVPAIFGGF